MDRREFCGFKAKGETVRGRVLIMNDDYFAFELKDELPNNATSGT